MILRFDLFSYCRFFKLPITLKKLSIDRLWINVWSNCAFYFFTFFTKKVGFTRWYWIWEYFIIFRIIYRTILCILLFNITEYFIITYFNTINNYYNNKIIKHSLCGVFIILITNVYIISWLYFKAGDSTVWWLF